MNEKKKLQIIRDRVKEHKAAQKEERRQQAERAKEKIKRKEINKMKSAQIQVVSLKLMLSGQGHYQGQKVVEKGQEAAGQTASRSLLCSLQVNA